MVTYGSCILGVPMGSQNFVTNFLNEVLSQNMAHINDLPLLGDTHVVLGILSLCVVHRPSYVTQIVPPFSLMFFLASFDKKVMQVCGDNMGPRLWEYFQSLLTKH